MFDAVLSCMSIQSICVSEMLVNYKKLLYCYMSIVLEWEWNANAVLKESLCHVVVTNDSNNY